LHNTSKSAPCPQRWGVNRGSRWLAAIAGTLAVLLVIPATGRAATAVEGNPNNYECHGHIGAGTPETGNTDHQVAYSFSCNGPITGYQLESQLPVTGFESAPLVSNLQGQPVTDTFSCSGEFPGYAVNCVGAAKAAFETVSGQFSIGTKLCREPREDPLLTVTYAYLEKGVVTQAISGPFDLGRPTGCPPSAFSGKTRLTANQGEGRASGRARKGKGKSRHGKRRQGGKHGK